MPIDHRYTLIFFYYQLLCHIEQFICFTVSCGWFFAECKFSRNPFQDELRHSGWQTSTFSISKNSHRGLPFFVSWHATKFLSQIRVDFLKMWNVSTRYVVVDDVWILRGKSPCTGLKIQVLVCSRSSESPRTVVRLCIWLHHLRTRRCVVLIWIFSCKSPSTGHKTQTLTGCFEYPRTVWCALLKSLLQLANPGSASASTLPQFCLLLFLPASFSPSF